MTTSFYPDLIMFAAVLFCQGSVQVSLATINPGNQTEMDSAPGDFSTVDDEGEGQSMQTFGE